MNKKKLSKAEKLAKKKRERILRIAGFVCAGIQLIASVVFIILLNYLDVLPIEFKALIDILLVLFCMVTAITQRWVIPGAVTKVLSVFMSIVLVAGSIYVHITNKTIDKISGSYTKVSTMGVYVLKDNPANGIVELEDSCYGIIANLERDDTNNTIDKIEEILGGEIAFSEYESIITLADALIADEVQAIIINSNYLTMLDGMEGYEGFENQIKCVMSHSIEKVIVEENNQDSNLVTSDNCFSIYISGIDSVGPPNVNSNSDVNIICTVNVKTHEIILISTPRDFFIPLSISGGVNDKLTHAGVYGVDVSMDTLEMLYGINIDYYLKVNFTGFVDIINALGGVDVYSEYDFVAYHGGYHYNVGMNHLNGLEALGFARERYSFAQGDRQRGRNQMEVIKALINKMTSKEMITNYNNVMSAVGNSMVTNMPQEEISELVKMQIEEMPTWNIMTYSVNGTGSSEFTYSMPNRSVYVMVPDQATVEKAREYLKLIHEDKPVTIDE